MSQPLRVHDAARLLIDDLIVLVDDVKDVFGGIHFLLQRHREHSEGGKYIISVVKHHATLSQGPQIALGLLSLREFWSPDLRRRRRRRVDPQASRL